MSRRDSAGLSAGNHRDVAREPPQVMVPAPESSPRRFAPLEPGDRVVVIGGGPAGLTAAYLLAGAGVPVTVLEADDVVGGISRTATYEGYRFDIGGHRFFTKIEPVQRMWEDVLGDELIRVPRLSRIHYRGRFFDYPLRAKNALLGLGLLESMLCVASYAKAQLWPSATEDNFEQWVSNRFGRRLYRIFFETYTEKVWGIACTEIRAEWAAQRIQNLSLAKAILSAVSINRRATGIKSLIDEFVYPRLGPGQMWELTRDRVVERGGDVRMRTRARRVLLRDGRAAGVEVEGPGGVEVLEAEHVISSMPIKSLVRALDPAPPRDVREAGDGLRYRDFLVVALVVEGEDLFPDNWIYIHTPGVKIGRVQNFNNWSRAMVPERGRTCLGLEYFCFEGDGLWTSSDEDLIERGKREMGELGLLDPATVRDGTVIRMRKAYPIYDGPYAAHLARARAWLDPIPNLHLVGRNGMHKYNNQDHSMLTAMMTVWNMRGASHDIWAVNTDFEYHEEQRLDEAEVETSAAGSPS